MTVHLVYSASDAIKTPFAIGRELSVRLRARYDVQVHEIRDHYTITPKPGDVLVGHPGWDPRNVFNASLAQPGWKRRLCLQPFAPGDPRLVANLAPIIPQCDLFLAITGPYWIDAMRETCCRHFAPKVVHVDLAVNQTHFPRIKTRFNPPGKRKFLYIGARGPWKNVPYLNQLAGSMPGTEFGWFGSTKAQFQHLRPLGSGDFATEASRQIAAQYDFVITVSRADANPTTILEAMSWGLIPVCTPQCGYDRVRGIINVPLDDLHGAHEVLNQLQNESEDSLLQLQKHNWEELNTHYNWDRFARQVMDAIESDRSPSLAPCRLKDHMVLSWYQIFSPQSRWRMTKLKARFREAVKR